MLFEEILPATVFRLILKSVLTFKTMFFCTLIVIFEKERSQSPNHLSQGHSYILKDITETILKSYKITILPTKVRKSVFMIYIYMYMYMCMCM